MTNTDCLSPEESSLDVSVVDALFDALSDSRRRFVVACLDAHSEPLTVRDLAFKYTAWEHGVSPAEIPTDEVETTHLELYHRHIPKLVAVGVVEYDRDRGTATLRESGEEPSVAVALARADRTEERLPLAAESE